MEENDIPQSANSLKNDDSLPPEKILYYRLVFSIYILILGFVYQFIHISKGYDNEDLSIPYLLGSAVGLSLVPLIIAFVRLALQKKPTKSIYILYFTISGIFFLLGTFSVIMESKYRDSSLVVGQSILPANNIGQNSVEYEFGCPNNEYRVKFQNKPKIIDGSIPLNDTFLKSSIAELPLPEFRSFCRAECFNLNLTENIVFDENYFYTFLNQYSEYNGLSYPNFTYEENNLGKIGTVRGYKTLTNDKGVGVKITYFAKVFSVNESVMMLYVGCPSEDYPTSVITNFLNSIKRI